MGFVLSTPQGAKLSLFDKDTVLIYDEEFKNAERRQKILVRKIVAGVEDKSTTLEEHKEYLKYITPQFRAGAILSIPPLRAEEEWQIGFIQGCTNMEFYNYYGEEGYTSWEFPEIEMGHFPIISDSDGSEFPWYGSSFSELRTLSGPTQKQDIKISMHDNFYPQVTWIVPSNKYKCNDPKLTNVRRHQNFYTWLVVRNTLTDVFYVLKTIQWKANIEIAINPCAELGHRSVLLKDEFSRKDCVLDTNMLIPKYVLHPPNANSAQTLIWRSKKDGAADIVVPPQWTILKYKVLFKKYSWLSKYWSKSVISKTPSGEVILSQPKEGDEFMQALEAFLNLRHNRKAYLKPKHVQRFESTIRTCD